MPKPYLCVYLNSFSHSTHHAADSLFGADSYPSSSTLHHRTSNDPWAHYPFASPSQSGYTATHPRSIHDLSYAGHHHHMTTTNAFNPRYSSLLIQPPVRPGRLTTMPGSQCDFAKTASSATATTEWPSPYSAAATAAAHVATSQPHCYGTTETGELL